MPLAIANPVYLVRPVKRGSFGLLSSPLLHGVVERRSRKSSSRRCASAIRMRRIRLTVWAQQDYSHLAALPSIADAFQDVFTEWAAANPGVQLEVSMMPALEQHKAKLLLAAAAGRLPDVASIDSFWLPLFLEGGHLQPLNRVLAGGRPRRLSAVHDRHAVGSHAATSTASGTRPTAARCSIARISCRFRRRRGTS